MSTSKDSAIFKSGETGKLSGSRRGDASDVRSAETHTLVTELCDGQMLLIGSSPSMKLLFKRIGRIAPTDSSVLITGATGTGKELVARAIHERSPRSSAPFVDINCSAIPETLIESELFGHQRGSFTGAHETRRGLFEEASGGTLFLDEVEALCMSAQAKLLRALQERILRRVGGRQNISFDIRIISATNYDLGRAVKEGTFRPDLLFRLRVVPLHIPELRERAEDIVPLVEHFLRCHAARRGEPARSFTPDAMRAIREYQWPGNVRELENAIEYALTISVGEVLDKHDLPPYIFSDGEKSRDFLQRCLAGKTSLAEVERYHILNVFERCSRHHGKTAKVLGIDRRTLYRKLRRYGVSSGTQISLPSDLAKRAHAT